MDRDRSRSPHATTPYEEIVRLVCMREQARLSKDWTLADTIREKLNAAGVTLYDKTSSWKSIDGQTGRIPTWSEMEAGQTPESIIAQQEMKNANVNPADGSEAHIKYLVQAREQARAGKDWASSDKLREELKSLGVEIFDKEKMWRAKNGVSGVIIGYRGAQGPTDLEISTLVVQRERTRQSGDYATSDMIRNELKAAGVEINDREKMWRSNDGRQGPVPSWTAILAGGSATGDVSMAAGLGQAAATAGGDSLRNQVLQAAMAAANNPATAARTLQLLQGAGGAGMAAPKPMGMAGMAGAGLAGMGMAMATGGSPAMGMSAGPPASANAECQEALVFIANCQATGRTAQDAEIDWLIGLREKFRHNKDWNAADELRNAIRKALGVEMHEREKKWTCTDGRQGVIPMWSTLM